MTTGGYASDSHYGMTIPVIIKSNDPPGTHSYRVVAWYQPRSLVWSRLHLYFAGGAGYWWAHSATTHRSLNIYALAPVFRYYFSQKSNTAFYGEISIGPAYLTRTHFSNRNLGMHFTFQDEIGVGFAYGKEKQFYTGLSALHYSNGKLASWNNGITTPIVLNMGFAFA
jgi:hypothetical protein